MGTLTIKPRPIGKKLGISINYTHKAQIKAVPFQRATGVTVEPEEFDKATGKVIKRTDSATMNQKIQATLKDVQYCLNECEANGVEPFKSNLDVEWEKLQQLKVTRETTEPQAQSVLHRMLGMLRAELEDLKLQVKRKEEEIEAEERKLKVYVSKNFITHIDMFLAQNDQLKENSKKNYTGLKDAVKLWKPSLNINDITKSTLNSFRNWLTTEKETRVIDLDSTEAYNKENPTATKTIYVKGLRNSSVRELLQKMKIVYYFFSDTYHYDITEVKKWKIGIKKSQNHSVVFLTKSEFEAVKKVKCENSREQIHRDFYLLMCNTGLRFVDALRIKKHHIINVENNLYLKIIQQKTTKPVQIPLTQDALAILEKYDYHFDYDKGNKEGVGYTAQIGYYMNRLMERNNICNYSLVRTNYKNNVAKEDESKIKRELINSHTARKTFINISLTNGMKITALKNIVGHSELNMIMDVYGDGSLNTEEMGKAGWDMPNTPTLPAVTNSKMKVVA
ncbi:hypothetical protein D0N36_03770 [Hymenobacter lapidiphilus]|uniref:tyrosine-type recombinase/integrase n=1 Tax=Hymenobacter sp. CCM 8763 TaxID=2303334 RepID=UPI000E346792|nr:tyrosine-type recombinase/integrase [Hymenobacter sp. CCM 8763]RFP66476.1 hypothetical protein D0N36_03770 [Hymenobacter sp. CCM 8763]